MERELSVTEAARNFSDVIARAHYRGESVRLTKNGRTMARIVPVEEESAPKGGAELAKIWTAPERPRLSPAEARGLAADLKAARADLPPVGEKTWE